MCVCVCVFVHKWTAVTKVKERANHWKEVRKYDCSEVKRRRRQQKAKHMLLLSGRSVKESRKRKRTSKSCSTSCECRVLCCSVSLFCLPKGQKGTPKPTETNQQTKAVVNGESFSTAWRHILSFSHSHISGGLSPSHLIALLLNGHKTSVHSWNSWLKFTDSSSSSSSLHLNHNNNNNKNSSSF